MADAAAPGYLHTAKGTIALVASASGLIAPGQAPRRNARASTSFASKPAARKTKRRTICPGAPANTPNAEDAQRILQSIRDARQRADLVIVYQHNHVFGESLVLDDFHRRHAGAAGAERLAEEVDASRRWMRARTSS